MYLLNRGDGAEVYHSIVKFTFHYVSIKSGIGGDLELNKDIYIPLCIY